MDESLQCECGNYNYWFFWYFARCKSCYNEYKIDRNPLNPSDVNYLMRRYNIEENNYSKNWEKFSGNFKNINKDNNE